MQRYVLRNTKDKLKLNTEKCIRRKGRTNNTEGIQKTSKQKAIDNLNTAITRNEIKFIVKKKKTQ